MTKNKNRKFDIKIDEDVLRGLKYLKVETELKTYSDVIAFLLVFYYKYKKEKEEEKEK